MLFASAAGPRPGGVAQVTKICVMGWSSLLQAGSSITCLEIVYGVFDEAVAEPEEQSR